MLKQLKRKNKIGNQKQQLIGQKSRKKVKKERKKVVRKSKDQNQTIQMRYNKRIIKNHQTDLVQ